MLALLSARNRCGPSHFFSFSSFSSFFSSLFPVFSEVSPPIPTRFRGRF